MSEKKKKCDKGNNNIPIHNLFDYSDTTTDFSECERLSESKLEQQLPCFSEYEPEYKLNSLMDSRLNDHLYGVYSSKCTETVSFMRTWTGFFVRQYRTKISQRVKPYLDSKKLSLDSWLMSVKHGQRGDIMLVYILSIMKGLHMCIHLKNGKTWSTPRAVPIHHMELMHRCDIILAYFSYGIYLQLVKRPLPISQHIVLGTILCDNPEVLNKLLLGKQELPKKKHVKKAVIATAGSQADLPRVEQDLRIDTSTRRLHKNSSTTQEPSACQTITSPTRSAPTTMTLGQKSCESSVNLDLPFSPLTGTTDKVTTLTTPEDTSFPGITASALPGTSSLKSEKPDHNVLVPLTPSTGQVRKHNLRKCLVSISRLTTADIMKYTRASMVKPLSIVLHKLPLNPSQIVRVVSLKAIVTHSKDPTSIKHTDRRHKVPKHKISGHPQSNKHVFHVKHHVLRKRTRKLYLNAGS